MADQSDRVAGARSWLYTPGTQPQRFDRAARAGADGLIIDLEDAVAARDKDTARAHAVTHLSRPAPGVLRAVRINPPATRAGLRDLDALSEAGAGPDAVVVPSARRPRRRDGGDGVRRGRQAPAVIALVESAAGVAGLQDLVRAPDLAAIAVGAADLSADLGCSPTWESLAARAPSSSSTRRRQGCGDRLAVF